MKRNNSYIALVLLIGIFICSCTGNGNKNKESNAVKDSNKQKAAIEVTKDNAFSTEAGMPVSIVSISDLKLVGFNANSSYAELTKSMKTGMPELLKLISDAHKTMTGPIYVVLDKMPESANSIQSFFIGIPVNDVAGIENTKTRIIKGNKYFKMEANAAPGEAIEAHKALQRSINSNKFEFDFPILETYRETPNSEMVQVLNKTIVYYPNKN